ncbi:MAG: shikimate dehydrogenase [Geminicoccaceae bacterium]|nr:MAG: shikimate dehydrogenase [Geminicoccaceae bacterium]
MTGPEADGLPPPLHGRTRIYAILGDPIAQVGSPGFFNALFRRVGLQAVLIPLHVAPAGLEAVVTGLRCCRNFDGLIVTVPHKVAVMNLVDEVGARAQRIGAINAIRREPTGRLVGENFDGEGCVAALGAKGHDPAGRAALVVGAGGAGAAVAHALADAGITQLRLTDLDAGKAQDLAQAIRRAHPALPVEVGAADPSGCGLAVNCTPLGMQPGDPLPIDPYRLDAGAIAVDVILQPAVSPFLAAAAARGHSIQTGPLMLEGQVLSIARYFGCTP